MTKDQPRERLEVEIDAQLLADLRSIAVRDGTSIDALIEDAVRNLLASRRHELRVFDAYLQSVEQFGSLYRKLAESGD